MEATLSMIGVCGGLGFMLMVVAYAWRFFNWVWLTPKSTEKCLRDQGLKGTSYKFLYGDVKEIVKMITEANLKPINVTDDILPRVLSFAHSSVTVHGKNCFTWAGPKPILHITDPTMIREILGKHEDFQKAKGANPLLTLLAKGLVLVEGDQWFCKYLLDVSL
ncbi:hypothetical protein L2E82_42425 [Cichorium intybus]|uniref:Uncharacterized protein n=1 Tax=Cichorium intybus TaxID=13427 RepID=A0ACB8ZLX0_CICIN|nr:hypothetical protein L2E82_42425 [Cichorium intybus]